MLRVAIRDTVPGMTVAMPVLHPDCPGHILLKPGALLESATVGALKDLGVRFIWIQYLPTMFLMRYAGVAIVHEQARLSTKLSECFDAIVHDLHADFDFQVYLGGVRTLVQRLLEDPCAAIFLGNILESRDPLLSHSTTVCYLSLLMGLKLGGYLVAERAIVGTRRAQNTENLGIGALFHDVGMLRLAQDVREKYQRTRDESDPQWQRHAGLGYDTVRGKIAPTAAAAVLHHHQRLDGSGFPLRPRQDGKPRALSGSEIHIFARIVAVADLFERALWAPGDEPGTPDVPVPTVRALRHMLAMARCGKIDPVVFKALLAVVPAYAPGAMVTLTDGRTCVVTSWDPTDPCRPVVCPFVNRVAKGPRDEEQLGGPIDLRTNHALQIAIVDGVDVKRDNFGPGYSGEFDTRFQYAETALGEQLRAKPGAPAKRPAA